MKDWSVSEDPTDFQTRSKLPKTRFLSSDRKILYFIGRKPAQAKLMDYGMPEGVYENPSGGCTAAYAEQKCRELDEQCRKHNFVAERKALVKKQTGEKRLTGTWPLGVKDSRVYEFFTCDMM